MRIALSRCSRYLDVVVFLAGWLKRLGRGLAIWGNQGSTLIEENYKLQNLVHRGWALRSVKYLKK